MLEWEGFREGKGRGKRKKLKGKVKEEFWRRSRKVKEGRG